MREKTIVLICSLFVLTLFGCVRPIFATSFTLVAPSGTLSRGQDVPFTININTQGSSVTSIQTGLTYDTTYLQYVSAVPGNAMNTITVDTSVGTGKLLLNGTNNTGFNGTGVYATVTLKIIADSPGSTEICTLWTPTITPSPTLTPTPALFCNNSCTTSSQCPSDLTCYIVSGQTTGVCRRATCTDRVDCVCLQPTSPPVPTALPLTGGEEPKNMGVVTGGILIVLAVSIFYFSKRSLIYKLPSEKKNSTKHKR